MQEYVGGDAYNFIIEASLRGGEISGALTAKAIYFAAAGILAVLSVSFLKSDDRTDEIRSDIQSVQMDVKDEISSLDKLVSNVSEQHGVLKNILTRLVESNVKGNNETYSLHAEEEGVEKNTEENA